MEADKRELLAVVALEQDRGKFSFGAPLFTAPNQETQERLAAELARMLRADGMRLSNGLMLLIRTPRG